MPPPRTCDALADRDADIARVLGHAYDELLLVLVQHHEGHALGGDEGVGSVGDGFHEAVDVGELCTPRVRGGGPVMRARVRRPHPMRVAP